MMPHLNRATELLLQSPLACPCVTAHLVFNRHAVASAPHTSSKQGKAALCAHKCITIFSPLDADCLADQDHGHPTIHPLPFDDQDLAHKRSDVHDLADLAILPRQDVVADAPERRLQVGHDLLTAHHQNHLAGRAGVRAKLTRRGGRCHQDAILYDRVDASQHEVGASDELADLARLVAVVDDHHLDIALPHPLGDSLDGLFGRGAREVFSQLGQIWVSFFYNCSTSRINSSFSTEA